MAKFSITWYEPQFKNLPKGFDGFCIALIADLHNKNFCGQLESEIGKVKPDIIVLAGDIVHKEFDYKHALAFIENAVNLAPVYFVNGNHECRFKSYPQFSGLLQKLGVIVLENKTFILQQGKSQIVLAGINDPKLFRRSGEESKKDAFKNKLSEICREYENKFTILLSHRPEFFNFYVSCGIDLTLSGHTHGGQIRLPFIGALYAPGQGFFPKYEKGLYEQNGKFIAVSSGLGRTGKTLPRIFNKPELVFVKLKLKEG